DETTPVEAALMWVVKLDKGPFTGREQIAEVKSGGAGRKLVGIVLRERIVPRQGYSLLVGDKGVGMVTSGVFSPTMGCGLGMAYIKDGYHSPESTVKVLIRSSQYDAVVVAKKDLLKPLTV
ncbi:MAG: glycine cleavage T C-terminal barrel domain-containing protein, partial [Chthonomonadales bacterium]